jgi:hypothetical protein
MAVLSATSLRQLGFSLVTSTATVSVLKMHMLTASRQPRSRACRPHRWQRSGPEAADGRFEEHATATPVARRCEVTDILVPDRSEETVVPPMHACADNSVSKALRHLGLGIGICRLAETGFDLVNQLRNCLSVVYDAGMPCPASWKERLMPTGWSVETNSQGPMVEC